MGELSERRESHLQSRPLGLLIGTVLSPLPGKQEEHRDQAQEWGSYSFWGFITEGEAWPWGCKLWVHSEGGWRQMAESESEPRTCPENSPASAEATPAETGVGIAGIGKGQGRKDYRWDKDRTLKEGPEHWAVSRDLQRLYSGIKRRFLGCRETWKQYAGGM